MDLPKKQTIGQIPVWILVLVVLAAVGGCFMLQPRNHFSDMAKSPTPSQLTSTKNVSLISVAQTGRSANITHGAQNAAPKAVTSEPDPVIYARVPAQKVTVFKTRTGKKYHAGSCRYLKKSKITTSVLDARQSGLRACRVCKPPQ